MLLRNGSGSRPVVALIIICALLWALQGLDAKGQDKPPQPPFTVQRPNSSTAAPYITLRVHNAGNLHLSVTNWGLLGSQSGWLEDPKTGQAAPSARYPSGSNFEHLSSGELWIGAVVNTLRGVDTLVSTATDPTELYPQTYGHGGDFIERSTDRSSPYFSADAITVQEFHCEYTDTLTAQAYVPFDPATLLLHRPLNIRIRQDSYVWPYDYGEDFVIVQYWITNMGSAPLQDVRIGLLMTPSVTHILNTDGSFGAENIVGFLPAVPMMSGYAVDDSIMTAWWADNDGDPTYANAWNEFSVRSVMGVRFLGTGASTCNPPLPLEYSFNWWASHPNPNLDWGPQKQPGDRSLDGALGTPLGDAQKYRFMAETEWDYDQYLANDTRMVDQGWMESPGIKSVGEGKPYNLADGAAVSLLYAIGPFELEPGDSLPIGVALVAGDNFHTRGDNGRNLQIRPDEYRKNLDFTDLTTNLQWASWIYDNPGLDSDIDGCAGLSFIDPTSCRDTFICLYDYCFEWRDSFYCFDTVCFGMEYCDSFPYLGDGIPDLKGPPPPPSPQFTIRTEPETIHIQWTGREIEHFYDPFSRSEDFEGYNVYGGLGYNPNSLQLMASWDLVNYDCYRFVPTARPSPWVLDGPPLTPEQLALKFDPFADPLKHNDKQSPYTDVNGSLYYFKPHGGNRGNEYLEGGAITPNPIQYLRTDSLWDERSQTWKPFGDYQCTIENLLPSQPYYFTVTAFDAGVAAGSISSLESPLQGNLQLAYPTYSPEYVQENRLQVSVYPNPYKIDAGYRDRGYEDPNREGFKERVRRIHFVNLPPECTIKIFSLDGDLVRELHHPSSRFSDSPSHTAWDLITRNTQSVVSGIYLYSIESARGTQIGKIVIIK